jgi:hypothetical protein
MWQIISGEGLLSVTTCEQIFQIHFQTRCHSKISIDDKLLPHWSSIISNGNVIQRYRWSTNSLCAEQVTLLPISTIKADVYYKPGPAWISEISESKNFPMTGFGERDTPCNQHSAAWISHLWTYERRYRQDADFSRMQKCSRLRATGFANRIWNCTWKHSSFGHPTWGTSTTPLYDWTTYPARSALLIAVTERITLLGCDTVLLRYTGTTCMASYHRRLN